MMRNDFNLNVNRETDDVIIKGYVDDDNQVIITEPDIGSGGGDGGGDGGGGSAGSLKLTFTEDPENEGTYVCDHTWQEIYDAVTNGVIVYSITPFYDNTLTEIGKTVTVYSLIEIGVDVVGQIHRVILNGGEIEASCETADSYPTYTE